MIWNETENIKINEGFTKQHVQRKNKKSLCSALQANSTRVKRNFWLHTMCACTDWYST